MTTASARRLIEQGVRMSRGLMSQQDKIWSRYSRDKVDIGETLARVLRTLATAVPRGRLLRALSVGSSTEPQFRLLEASFRGGLYLLDIEQAALAVINERVRRQAVTHVFPLRHDYTRVFRDRDTTRRFLREELGGRRLDLVAFEHSLYYCPADRWRPILENIVDVLLRPVGAVHAVLMSASARDSATTNWLYNHFAGKFFGHRNDQDLRAFARAAQRDGVFGTAQVLTKTDRVSFFVDDFRALMSVVWMILLYPNVHRYTTAQRREITEHVYRRHFMRRRPLLQDQDHLVIYRGVRGRGLM
ncbi:MAG TPA: class I SAM-dependent methyltransferase [Candidatus Methylomirabilis sp.]|nr:class I SAM-dependent methyltransferase [Candidatus Methylomirabilis sp.]